MADGGPCDDLSILCVTKAEPCVHVLLSQLAADALALSAELVWACDGTEAAYRVALGNWPLREDCRRLVVHSRGYIESALDEAVAATTRSFILRIDDDEQISPAMFRWLKNGEYRNADHWQFPRQQFWRSNRALPGLPGILMTPHLYPDFQTRLSVRSMAGGRNGVHAPSPHGGGEIAPVALWHWKFVIRTREDRRRIAQTYDSYSPGYGTGNMKPFSLPEEAYKTMTVVEAGDGSTPWTPKWSVEVDNSQSRQDTQNL